MYFSICIPSYNREHFISRALDSLVAQTFKDFEVIVVDDGSIDNTKDVIQNYQDKLDLKYIKKKNGGKHSALNVGIENAKGIFFVILDSDDWFTKEALDILHSLCITIEKNSVFSGVLCRSVEYKSNKLIGDPIPNDLKEISYIDMHFRLRTRGIDLCDCCECNKTNILKEYRFPEQENMKFVPEAWLFDQIGVEYMLLASNEKILYKEYLQDGITLDTSFKAKNNLGFLYHYVSRIENILPRVKHTLKDDIIAWWRYWQAVSLDRNNNGQRVKHVTLFGYLIKNMMPVINLFYKIRYKHLYEKGR